MSNLIYPIGFYAFESVFFATIYSNNSYFISGAGNISIMYSINIMYSSFNYFKAF